MYKNEHMDIARADVLPESATDEGTPPNPLTVGKNAHMTYRYA